ncbi:hypothetical protein SDC9_176697 [bioreactor metagenome]|uniref:Uncharacterized protein n=1 Tax=bioreactor metagenome TaxID=1076179 RepID=A0A645GSQ5_9ZZZZ
MPQLVHQRKHIFQRVVIVQQHIRVKPIGAGRVRTGLLVVFGVNIDPPVLQCLLHALGIIRPQRRGCL